MPSIMTPHVSSVTSMSLASESWSPKAALAGGVPPCATFPAGVKPRPEMSGEGALVCGVAGVAPGVAKRPGARSEELRSRSE